MDEPRYGNFHSNAYLMRYFSSPGAAQTLGDGGKPLFELYADSVVPMELWFDDYPFFGAGYPYGRTPVDCGDTFQLRLDEVCNNLADMRLVADTCNKNFWYAPQAFGKYDSVTATNADEGGNEGRWRLPTERELRCNTWIGLAYGVKGIVYFLYRTRVTHEADTAEWMRGLWRFTDNSPREPLFSEAREINKTLEKIGPTLLTLTSDTVFKYIGPDCPEFPTNCFIDYISNDDTVQVGTFHADSDSFFIIVNRLCQPTDFDTVIVRIKTDSIFLYDIYTDEAIPPDNVVGGKATFIFSLPPGQGRCFQLVRFASGFKINNNESYANMRYAALNTKAWPQESIDSMRISQTYRLPPDTLIEYEYSTGWIPYDTAYCWYLRQSEGTHSNIVSIQYIIDGTIITPTRTDTIIFDSTPPTGSFVIDDDSAFTNSSSVTLTNSMVDSRSGMAQIRFGNKHLKNLVINSAFDSSGDWEYTNATYIDTLGLFELTVDDSGTYLYQSILPESLADFDNDTILLWIDLVDDDFTGAGKVIFQYIYGLPTDTIDPRGQYPCGDSITIPQGTNARVSWYNLASYFKYHPTPPPGKVLLEARVGVFVDAGAGNAGRLFIDNLRLDVVSPYRDYSKFGLCDSTESWVLVSGNGMRKVFGQFADGAGNETGILWESIIVDTTRPVAIISSPPEDRVLSGDVGITGYAFDCADPTQHFMEYGLYYQGYELEAWYGIHPDSIFYNPVDSNSPSQKLATWNTKQVTDDHGDGWYYLRLTVSDSADNYRGDTLLVYIRNDRGAKGEIAGFANDVYGLAAADEIFVGELGTGKIYRYDSSYQLLDTFALVDSIGIGLPLAMALDDSGKLWVTNIISHYVNRFTPQGNLLLQFTGGFFLPSGVVLDETGNEWISDRLHHKIKKFDGMGNLLYQFGIRGRDPGEIDRPIGVALCDGKIYVADSRNRRISIFDTLGTFIRIIGDSAGLVMPFGLVVDSTGCVFVSDFLGNQIIEFGPSGNRLFGIDSILDSPTGLALSSDMKTLYVSDTKNRRVLAFVVRDEPPLFGGGPQVMGEVDINKLAFDIYPSPFSSRLTIKLQGIAGNRLILKFYDVIGRLIKTFFDDDLTKCDQNIIWDGKDNQQRKCAAGVYFLRLEIGDHIDIQKVVLMR